MGYAVASLVWGTFFLDQIAANYSWSTAVVFWLLAGISLLLPEKQGEFKVAGLGGVKTLVQNKRFIVFVVASFFIGATLSAHNSYQTIFFQSLDASAFFDWIHHFVAGHCKNPF